MRIVRYLPQQKLHRNAPDIRKAKTVGETLNVHVPLPHSRFLMPRCKQLNVTIMRSIQIFIS